MSAPAAPRAVVRSWLSEPLPRDVRGPLDLLARTPGIARIAVMPDVHWSEGVCVGVVVGARDRLFPDAVGRDIGCGVAAEAYDLPADRLRDASVARLLLDDLARLVPVHRHGGDGLLHRLPDALDAEGLSDAHLRRLADRDGRVQFATIGRGNHFLELQADDGDRLWAMVHSGSRAMGHAIHAHHLRSARRASQATAPISRRRSRGVMRRRASDRGSARPAPCAQDVIASGQPRPAVWNETVPIEPGTIPASPSAAETAPFRWTQRSSPKCVSSRT